MGPKRRRAATRTRAERARAKALAEDVLRYRMSRLGLLGGAKGGRARAAALPPEERRRIAKKAAQARWARRGRKSHEG